MRQYVYQPCIPTHAATVPIGPDWLHEIKHDGYRLMVQREGNQVRLFTRRGFDWSDRFPRIIEAARRLRALSFVIDGEAVWLDEAGLSHFDRLHSRQHDAEVRLVAFDLLAVGSDDIRREPLHARKAQLTKLLAKSGDALQVNPHMEGEVGVAMFEHACKLGLEGIVSKRRNRAYSAGRCTHWVKIKNADAPAVKRLLKDGAW
jgi:bifunctional non-homologous end joining protein LigD